MEILLGASADVNAKAELCGHTPLILASRFKHEEAVSLLLGAGATHHAGPLESRLMAAVDKEEDRRVKNGSL